MNFGGALSSPLRVCVCVCKYIIGVALSRGCPVRVRPRPQFKAIPCVRMGRGRDTGPLPGARRSGPLEWPRVTVCLLLHSNHQPGPPSSVTRTHSSDLPLASLPPVVPASGPPQPSPSSAGRRPSPRHTYTRSFSAYGPSGDPVVLRGPSSACVSSIASCSSPP